MNREQILDLYEWHPGVCFRHPAKGEVLTAHVETIRPAGGGLQDVRACADCIVEMEELRTHAGQVRGADGGPTP